jgi:hypothetical protein
VTVVVTVVVLASLGAFGGSVALPRRAGGARLFRIVVVLEVRHGCSVEVA